MKLKIFVLVILFTLSAMVLADKPQAPQPILKPGDVKNFIKTFPLLKEDLKKFDVKYDGKSGSITYPEALAANQEFLGILEKYGWDEHYFEKTAAICLGYSMIVYGKEMEKVDPEITKAMKEIESNPHLSADMKKQLIEQMKSVKGVMKEQQKTLKRSVHEADMALIKPQLEDLKRIFENN